MKMLAEHKAKIGRLALVFFTTILLLPLFTGCPADPGTLLTVNNQADQKITIFIDNLQSVDVSPSESLEFGTTLIQPNPSIYPADYEFLIEAKTKAGEVVYSENFTWQELDGLDWIIVIPSSTKVP